MITRSSVYKSTRIMKDLIELKGVHMEFSLKEFHIKKSEMIGMIISIIGAVWIFLQKLNLN